jgi:hypothetical protein
MSANEQYDESAASFHMQMHAVHCVTELDRLASQLIEACPAAAPLLARLRDRGRASILASVQPRGTR